MPAELPRTLCISLHDVAPATLGDCVRMLTFLDELHQGPIGLLVIPDLHGTGRVDRDRRFMSFIESRILHGDEIVLHGYRHDGSAPPDRGLRAWLARWMGTDPRAEFSSLPFEAARTRLLHGLAILRTAGWQPSGFVAPGWRMSSGTCDALEDLPLRYFSTRDAVTLLGSQQRIPAPTLTLGAPANWGKAAGWPWIRALARLRATNPVLRIAMHPTDQRDPAFERFWRHLRLQIDDRLVLTEDQLVSRLTRRAHEMSLPGPGRRSAIPRAGRFP
jgi:predicted deacetylase